jgi:broad specificity phosphatase PhoE
MLIYLVRHGETDANVRGLLQGWTDEPLNENGIRLAEITGRALNGVKFDCCYSSPLSRARKTAEIILKETGCDIPVQCDDRLKEINIGYDDSKPVGEGILSAEEAGKFLHDPWNFIGFPGGENIRQVCERTQSFLKELISSGREGTYLVGTHGCAVRAMLNFLYRNPEDFWRGHLPYNCCVNIVEADGVTARIVAEDRIYYPAELAVDHFSS